MRMPEMNFAGVSSMSEYIANQNTEEELWHFEWY